MLSGDELNLYAPPRRQRQAKDPSDRLSLHDDPALLWLVIGVPVGGFFWFAVLAVGFAAMVNPNGGVAVALRWIF